TANQAQAEKWYAASIDRLKKLPPDKRQKGEAKRVTLLAHSERAANLTEQRQYDEAIKDFDQAVELAEGAIRTRLGLRRAMTRAQSGDHARAVTESEELLQHATKDGGALYELSGVYCASALAVDKDLRLSEKERSTLKQEYLTVAGGILDKAQQA